LVGRNEKPHGKDKRIGWTEGWKEREERVEEEDSGEKKEGGISGK